MKQLSHILLIGFLLLFSACKTKTDHPADRFGLIHEPVKTIEADGVFRPDSETGVLVADRANKEMVRLAGLTAALLQLDSPIGQIPKTGDVPDNSVVLKVDPSLAADGGEAYRLSVTSERISLAGASEAGLFYAIQTLKQLLPVASSGDDRSIPAVKVEEPHWLSSAQQKG